MCPILHLVRNIERTEDEDQLETTDDEKNGRNPSEFCITIFLKVAPSRKIFWKPVYNEYKSK